MTKPNTIVAVYKPEAIKASYYLIRGDVDSVTTDFDRAGRFSKSYAERLAHDLRKEFRRAGEYRTDVVVKSF